MRLLYRDARRETGSLLSGLDWRCAGRDIITIEGLPSDGKPHPIQLQMVNRGGIQCGYCTPGIIMSAYALLRENLSPTEEEIKLAISGNICRCTGYNKIVEAVQAAAADLRGS
ncbi:MAG: 2Fe-2S iron-sulfur cluster-binding protein [Acidimicrobiia bacterium]